MELEELSRLEKKIKHLEKAETAAVDKVKILESENSALQTKLKNLQIGLDRADEQMESMQSEINVYSKEVNDLICKEADLKKIIKNLELQTEKMDEIDAERIMLQQKLTDQQMQISSLQSNLQTLRHKSSTNNSEELLKEEIEALKTELKLKEMGRKELEQKNNVAQVRSIEVD